MDYEFGMFSGAGEDVVYDIVKLAGKHALSDSTINAILKAVSDHEEAFKEASDTVVRERVFGFLNRAAW
jgi:hypothetical protein